MFSFFHYPANIGNTGTVTPAGFEQYDSMAQGIAAQVMDQAFDDLDAPVRRLNGVHTPTPYSPPLEDAHLPGPERIAADVLARP